MRWGIRHVPGRLAATGRRRVVRVIDGWLGADTVPGAYHRITALS